ncbi:MAG: glycosyltransferase [Acutalibacteraceae bacterium]|nr:glycosyltransferase [Acutalibacteraceae bacterium]
MISKTIHYCWFGGNPKPDLIKKCIESWKLHCPEYEIKEWNETNFDINMCKYTKEAYKAKKYAFVSDVARLWIIYNYGGFYFDTDVELKKNIDDLTKYDAWFSADSVQYINTGIGFGATINNHYIKSMLDDYFHAEYTETPCTIRNTTSLRNKHPEIPYFYKTQIIDNVCFFGLKDGLGSYLRHYYTATWKTEDGKPKEGINTDKPSKWAVIRWKIQIFFQNPKLVKYCETHPNIFTKLYMIFTFDFLPHGFKHTFKVFKYILTKKQKNTN